MVDFKRNFVQLGANYRSHITQGRGFEKGGGGGGGECLGLADVSKIT